MYSIKQTSDGGYIMAGKTYSNDGDVSGNHGNGDFWVVKLNSVGDIVWQRCFGGSGDDWATSIHPTVDGGYIVTGWTKSTDGDVKGYHADTTADIWILKLDSLGNILWQRCVDGTKGDYIYSACVKPNGDIVIAVGTTSDSDSAAEYHSDTIYSALVIKLSAEGEILWQRRFGGSRADAAVSIRSTTDGGYIFVGATNSQDIERYHGDTTVDIWVVKLDANGELQWQKCLGGSNNELAYSIYPTAEGGYIVAGFTDSNDGDVSGNHDIYFPNGDIWVVKLTPKGELQWQKCFGGEDRESATSICPTGDGGFIVIGGASYDSGDVSGCHTNQNQPIFTGDAWILKIK